MKSSYSIEDFLHCEIKKIEIDKWCEGIRIHSDPGNDYVLYWVEVSASSFRDDWEDSLCKSCDNKESCGWQVKSRCNNYKHISKVEINAI